MISEIGNNIVMRRASCVLRNTKGFTLIEVLLSVVILAVGLVAVIGGYHTVLDAHKKANFISEGYLILQQKIVDGRLEMLSEKGVAGSKSGSEGAWRWSTKITKTPLKDVYELNAEAVKKINGRKLLVATYVRK